MSNHLIIGTAGHVDHGKTALIRALTGADTDRLPEEKARGISIDIGFAQFTLPSGRQAAVIDVPGHERFIKNMLAGITGIDLVLLVVAADEGVMPQTREHLDILRLLEIKHGMVALTKKDLVDEELLELVADDVAQAVRGTFLEGAPVVAVSSVTGEGLDELRARLDSMLAGTEAKDVTAFTRLPIDRAFIRPGFGTVVTGTLVAGTIKTGDRLDLLPLGLEVRVRGLQVHGSKLERAEAGQRVAVNLAGIERADVSRGMVLCAPGMLRPTRSFAVKFHLLASWPKAMGHGTRVHLHTGTSEILARLLLLDRNELEPGGTCYVQAKAEADVVVGRGDHCIVRSYSPVHTMGGGVVIEPHANYRKGSRQALAELQVKETGGLGGVLAQNLARSGMVPLTVSELAKRSGIPAETVSQELAGLAAQGEVRALENGYHVHRRGLGQFILAATGYLDAFYQQYPLRVGALKEELRRKVLAQGEQKGFQALLAAAVVAGELAVERDRVALPGRSVTLTPAQQQAVQAVVAAAEAAGFNPPAVAELAGRVRLAEMEELVGYLAETGAVVRVGADLVIHQRWVAEARARLKEWLGQKGKVTVAEFRDLLGTSRKYAMPLLEWFDEQRFTRRAGDDRLPGPAFHQPG